MAARSTDPNPRADAAGPLKLRRELLKAAGGMMALLVSPLGRAAETRLLAVRVWPAPDYTRITLEGQDALRHTHQIVHDPERLVVDLEGVEFNSILQSLPAKITEADPYIRLIRAGRNRPGVVRVVVELKAEIRPQVFALPPVGDYGHRLVLDLYPTQAPDPLLALIEKPDPAQAAAGLPAGDGEPTQVAVEHAPEPAVARTQNNSNEEVNPAQTQTRGRDKASPAINRLVTIALDPGHGGEDPGAVGRAGTYEKNVTLAIARRLKARIDAEPGMRAMLTRDGDYFVPLQQRVVKARQVQADLFVSIHADAFVKPDARGSSVFVLSEKGASSTAARWLAQRENAADLVGGVNIGVQDAHLARTLLDLSQTATMADSLKLGRAVLTELGGINRLHKNEVEQAGFAVLKAPDIPSVLVETAFISNPEEEARLADDAYQGKMADALLRGIRKYFTKHPPASRARIALAD